MAHEEEPLLAHPPTQEVARHVHDYERFTKLLKYGFFTCVIIAALVLMIIS